MAIREIVRIVETLVGDDGTTLERQHGPQATAIAHSIKSVISTRFQERSPYASLWRHFEDQPQAMSAELTGALEALVEADLLLARRLRGLMKEYRGVIAPPAAHVTRTWEWDVAVAGAIPGAEMAGKGGDEVDQGIYLYGSIKAGAVSIGKDIQVKENGWEDFDRIVMAWLANHVPDLETVTQKTVESMEGESDKQGQESTT